LIGGQQFERSIVMADLDDAGFYVADIFRVVGGNDHAKLTHSHFSQISTEGLSLRPGIEYGHGALLRNFQTDPTPRPGWVADWRMDDRYGYLSSGTEVHLRYTDLTSSAQATICEAWVLEGSYALNKEAWLPTVIVRRQSDKAPLASTFAGVFEVYGKAPNIAAVRRLPLETASGVSYPDSSVATEVRSANGCCDLIVAADAENPLSLSPSRAKDHVLVQKDWQMHLDGELCMIRGDQGGRIQRIALCRGKSVKVGDVSLQLNGDVDFVEVVFDGKKKAKLASGKPQDVQSILVNGQSVWEH
jgi:hypothetical protein